ncbi:peptidase M24, structural domain-containing protein [Gorgonomyces haynaldii]|nr:peptidase M24, structural domain-containing protein [Gorgonomyces haynaldii]
MLNFSVAFRALFFKCLLQTHRSIATNKQEKSQTVHSIMLEALKKVVSECTPGKSVYELTRIGNETIAQLASEIDEKIKKGVAFPTSVSVNELVCHVAPIPSDPEAKYILKEGDVVRIELGAHVDGYITQAAQTLVLGQPDEDTANVLKATYLATQALKKVVKPGNTSEQAVEIVQKICADFGVEPMEGMVSQQLLQNVLDGPNQIQFKPPKDQKPVSFEFKEGEVYALDVMLTTGSGKTKQSNVRTTVFKRNPDATYQLKMKTSRMVFSQIIKECGTMAFSLDQLGDEKKARMGISECESHGLVTGYHVVKDEAKVAHLVLTVLLAAEGPVVLGNFEWKDVKATKEASEEIKKLLK